MQALAIILAAICVVAAGFAVWASFALYAAKTKTRDAVLAETALRTALDAAMDRQKRLEKEVEYLEGDINVLQEALGSDDANAVVKRLRGMLQGKHQA